MYISIETIMAKKVGNKTKWFLSQFWFYEYLIELKIYKLKIEYTYMLEGNLFPFVFLISFLSICIPERNVTMMSQEKCNNDVTSGGWEVPLCLAHS